MTARRSQCRRALGLLLILSACASRGGGLDPGAGLDAGALALRQAEFEAARERLAAVRLVCGEARLGRQALLLLAALELDPRNPAADPDRAAAFAARYLARFETFPWTRPVAEQLYLQALRAGGRPTPSVDPLLQEGVPDGRSPEACDRSEWGLVAGGDPPVLGALPRTPGPAPARRSAGDESAALRSRIAELEAELERIRATLQP